MKEFFTLKTFLGLLAAAVVLAAVIVLVEERFENSQPAEIFREVEVTRIVQQTVLVTSVAEKIITATPGPSATLPVCPKTTDLPAFTPTPKSLAVAKDGLTIWCQPATSYNPRAILPMGQPPEDALIAARLNGTLSVTTQVKNCTFLVRFNDAASEGVRLKIQDLGPQPFIDVKLNPVEGDPTLAYITTDHYFIIDPPYWEVLYFVRVYGPDDTKLLDETVNFRRVWIPEPCANGLLPDIHTLNCEPGNSEKR